MTSNHHDYDPFRSANSGGAYQAADDAWVDEQSTAARHGGEGMELIKPPVPVEQFRLRHAGSSDFLSRLGERCEYVTGWNNPAALTFGSRQEAEQAKIAVMNLDGMYMEIEPVTVADDL